MTSRRNFIKSGTFTMAGLAFSGPEIWRRREKFKAYESKRPAPGERNFTSKAVEDTIQTTKAKIQDPKLAWMFENCFPNTLDTTVEYGSKNGKPDTFVITGDIHAMWLRDSSAQVWPYLPMVTKDNTLKNLIAGVINRQTQCILLDPYANAFNKEPVPGEWMSDHTDMKPGLHERKWELDSLCYTVRLAYHYWKITGDNSVFDADWHKSAALIIKTFKEQQRKNGLGPYRFERETTRQLDTLSNNGYGRPLRPVGLINSSFRPSDDATTYGFLIPSNLFAVTSLNQMAAVLEKVIKDTALAGECNALAEEVKAAINQYAVTDHLNYGKVYAYEADGFGNKTFMDDANVPGLLSMPYLGCVDERDEIYQHTRNLVWGKDNPYFFKGMSAEGIGGPHVGYNKVWPMSIIMRALTSHDDHEIAWCVKTIRDTDAGTGFIHESFNRDDPGNFTRPWFAWANTLFGELILKLVNEGKENLLRS